jgi:predicted ATPase
MQSALEKHNAILGSAIADQHGYVFKIIGDAFQAAFNDPLDALQAATSAQLAFSTQQWETENPIRVRMGLHTGPAEVHDGDYSVSHTLNRTARIAAAGHGGQILLSLATAELLRDRLPVDIQLSDLGDHYLKGLSRQEHIFQVNTVGLAIEYPPLVSLSRPHHNLPSPLTTFVGRKTDLLRLSQRVQDTRLVTLTGSGGVGKSRLAIETAWQVVDVFTDGVYLIELAALANPALVKPAIASALGLRDDGSHPISDTLVDHLRSKNILLILDNCEHLIEICAAISEFLLQYCPALHIFCSSREPLGVDGELVVRVPSLSFPDSEIEITEPDQLYQYEAIRLFIERAQAVQPDFILSLANACALVQICHRLDGIPLAIELAAARVRILDVEQIAARLDDSFRLLTGGSRTALPRQQTLRATIDWSYTLLSEEEKILFRRLAVFSGGFTLETVEAVCTDSELPDFYLPFSEQPNPSIAPPNVSGIKAEQVLDLLDQLVNKSLVIVDLSSRRGVRYYLLETVRQYTREALFAAGESDYTRRRHCQWFIAWVEDGIPRQHGPGYVAWMDALQADLDNLRYAVDWAEASGCGQEVSLRLGSGLHRYWWARGNLGEAIRWLKRGLDNVNVPPPLLLCRARGLYTLSWACGSSGLLRESLKYAKSGVELYRTLGMEGRPGLVEGLGQLGQAYGQVEMNDEALEATSEAVQLGRTLQGGDRWSLALALWSHALIYIFSNQIAESRIAAEESWTLFQSLGDRWNAGPLIILGDIERLTHNYRQAHQYLDLAIERFSEAGDLGGKAGTLNSYFGLALSEGDMVSAMKYFLEGLRIWYNLGSQGTVMNYIRFLTAFQVEYLLMNQKADTLDRFTLVLKLWATTYHAEEFASPQEARDIYIYSWLTFYNYFREHLGNPLNSLERENWRIRVNTLIDTLGDNEFYAAILAGKALSLEDAIGIVARPATLAMFSRESSD